MITRAIPISIFALVCLLAPARGEDAAVKLIGQLDNEDFSVRDEAQRVLRQMGKEALPDLTARLQKASPEALARMKLVINQIEKDLLEQSVHEREGHAIVKVYYIKDLLESPSEFTGPSLILGDDIDPGNQRHRDDKNDEKLIALIKSMVDQKSWDSERFSIGVYRGVLVVSHTPETQEKIAALLTSMRTESEPQMAIASVLLDLKDGAQKDVFSTQEFESLLGALPPEAVLIKTRLLCSNLRRAVALDGKQLEYIGEAEVVSTEGGGILSRARAQQCLDGNSLSVFPRLNTETGAVNLELRFSRNTGLAMRDIGEMEKWIANQARGEPAHAANPALEKAAKPAEPAAPENAAQPKMQMSLPSSNIQHISTDVVAPRDTWICAGRLQAQDDRKEAELRKNQSGQYLFIRVELLTPASVPAVKAK